MPALSDKPLQHVHFRIYKEDAERLQALFGHTHGGVNRAVRAALHSFLNHNYATLHAKIDEIERGTQAQAQEQSDAK